MRADVRGNEEIDVLLSMAAADEDNITVSLSESYRSIFAIKNYIYKIVIKSLTVSDR